MVSDIEPIGGFSIFNSLDNLSVNKSDFHFLIDYRLDIESIQELKMYKTTKVEPSHYKRKTTYLSEVDKYDKIVCLSNIPPPIKLNKTVYIYFHNLLLVTFSLNFSSSTSSTNPLNEANGPSQTFTCSPISKVT